MENVTDDLLRKAAIARLYHEGRIAFDPDNPATKSGKRYKEVREAYVIKSVVLALAGIGAIFTLGPWSVFLGLVALFFSYLLYRPLCSIFPESVIDGRLSLWERDPIAKLEAVQWSIETGFRDALKIFSTKERDRTFYRELRVKRDQASLLMAEWKVRAVKAIDKEDKQYFLRREEAASLLERYLAALLEPLVQAKKGIEQAQSEAEPYILRLREAIKELKDEQQHASLVAYVGSGAGPREAQAVLSRVSHALAKLSGLVTVAQQAHDQAKAELANDKKREDILARIAQVEGIAQAAA